MDKLELKEYVYEFADNLRQVLPYYGFSANAIYLIFMKYVCDFDDAETAEEFKILMSYKNMFITKIFSKEIVEKAFKLIEDIYKIDNSLLTKCIPILEEEFANDNDYLFNNLNFLELPKDNKEKISFINYILEFSETDVTKSINYQTNESLSDLVSKILNVKENETYLDTFCGFNRTALKFNASEYIGYELFTNITIAANMIMVMLSRKNFKILNEDFYNTENKGIADKVFCDGPIGLKLNKSDIKFLEKGGKSSEYFNIKMSIEALKEQGIACIVVPSRVLSNDLYKELRKELTESKLKAVIALPPLSSGFYSNANLVVFENNKNNNNVIMVDASNGQYINKVTSRTYELKDETINLIIDSFNGTPIENFSRTVEINEIVKNDTFSWQPQAYIKKRIDTIFRPSKEVKKELEETYKDLVELLK